MRQKGLKLYSRYFNLYGRWSAILVLFFLVGAIDVVTGYELGFFVFYFIPVAFIARFGNRPEVLLACAVGAALWFASDVLSGRTYSNSAYQYWNAGIRFVSFVAIGLAVHALQRAQRQQRMLAAELEKSLETVRKLAETDPLTGLWNQRVFYNRLEEETARARRHPQPFTLVYMDLDNFKQVNDTLGHDQGDRLLQEAAQCLRGYTRATDVAARLGGDEFAILFPETTQQNARAALEKMKQAFAETMQRGNWPVTCSAGAVTFNDPPENIQDAIKLADALMYTVKHSGKNNFALKSWPEV